MASTLFADFESFEVVDSGEGAAVLVSVGLLVASTGLVASEVVVSLGFALLVLLVVLVSMRY